MLEKLCAATWIFTTRQADVSYHKEVTVTTYHTTSLALQGRATYGAFGDRCCVTRPSKRQIAG